MRRNSHSLTFHNLIIYFLTSGLAAFVNLLSRILYSQWLSFNAAVVCAYFSGMLVNFCLSSLFVFSWQRGNNVLQILIKFTFIATIGLVVTVVASELAMIFFLWLAWCSVPHSELFAHVFGIGMAFFVSFVGHSLVTYRKTGLGAAITRLFP